MKLIELDISDSLAVTESSLDKILEKNHELKVLSMNRCYNIDTPRLFKWEFWIVRNYLNIIYVISYYN